MNKIVLILLAVLMLLIAFLIGRIVGRNSHPTTESAETVGLIETELSMETTASSVDADAGQESPRRKPIFLLSDEEMAELRAHGRNPHGTTSTQLLDNWEKEETAPDPFSRWVKPSAQATVEVPFPWNLFPVAPPSPVEDDGEWGFIPPHRDRFIEEEYHPWGDY